MAARSFSPRSLLVAAAGLFASAAVVGLGCVNGATPDCSSPDAGCGPGIEGGLPLGDAEAGVSQDAPNDTTVPDSAIDSAIDSGADVQPGSDASDAASDGSSVDGDATTD
jgi:hypothetical protein